MVACCEGVCIREVIGGGGYGEAIDATDVNASLHERFWWRRATPMILASRRASSSAGVVARIDAELVAVSMMMVVGSWACMWPRSRRRR